jgi:hypothetical protein
MDRKFIVVILVTIMALQGYNNFIWIDNLLKLTKLFLNNNQIVFVITFI